MQSDQYYFLAMTQIKFGDRILDFLLCAYKQVMMPRVGHEKSPVRDVFTGKRSDQCIA